MSETLKARAKRLWTLFSLTIEQWTKIDSYQNSKCFICGNPTKDGRRLATDHSHQTGLIRGLLCSTCNRILGKIEEARFWQKDTAAKLLRAALYVQSPPAVEALGYEVFTYPGKLGTGVHKKWLKKQKTNAPIPAHNEQ